MEETKVADAVDALVELCEDEDRTRYQLALLCIQITWWADPEVYGEIEEYGEEVFTLCQEMRDAEPEATRHGAFAEMLEHLQSEARDALAYVREQADRVRRRPRARKWHHYIQDNVPRPRVASMSGRIVLKRKQQREEGLEGIDTSEDADGSDNNEDDMQEKEEYDGIEMDDLDGRENDENDEEGEEEAPFNKHGVESNVEYEYYRESTSAAANNHVVDPTNGSENGTDGKLDPRSTNEP
jgi:hypothetical protein